jgi:hypothetical protein
VVKDELANSLMDMSWGFVLSKCSKRFQNSSRELFFFSSATQLGSLVMPGDGHWCLFDRGAAFDRLLNLLSILIQAGNEE